MKFVWGTIAVLIGLGMMRYSFQIVQIFGKIGWAENHLSDGGTYTLHKLIGLLIIILGLLYMFGGIGFVLKPLAPVFGG